MEVNTLAKTALLGSLVGGLAVLFLTPKSGKAIREDIAAGYDTINHQTHDIAEYIKDQGHRLYDYIQGIEEDHSHNSLLLGGAIGAVIGATAAMLLAPQSGNKLRKHLGNSYDEICEKAEDVLKNFSKKTNNIGHKIEDWKDVFTTLVHKLSLPKQKQVHGAMNEIADWADLGLHLYTQLQKRR